MASLNLFKFFLPFLLGVFLIRPSLEAPEDSELCGQGKPDPSKTCISIRLPWRRAPIYFCTPKDSIKYKNKCKNQFASNCKNPRNDTLMIATPWECCPLMSFLDTCAKRQCPPPPYERKCQEVAPEEDECCPSYFCEEDITPDLCHFRLLEPDCHNPPGDKKNCVGFKDSHGCCPKWQCEGDTKPGECPMEARARKKMAAYKPTNKTGIIPPPREYYPEESSGTGDNGGYQVNSSRPVKKKRSKASEQRDACVGDYNCPGEMKCCSNDMTVYYREGHYLRKNRSPTKGYCTNPAKNDDAQDYLADDID